MEAIHTITAEFTEALCTLKENGDSSASAAREEWYQGLLSKLTAKDMAPLGKAPDTYELSKWQAQIESKLSLPMWKVDGVSILFIADSGDVVPEVRSRNEHLC